MSRDRIAFTAAGQGTCRPANIWDMQLHVCLSHMTCITMRSPQISTSGAANKAAGSQADLVFRRPPSALKKLTHGNRNRHRGELDNWCGWGRCNMDTNLSASFLQFLAWQHAARLACILVLQQARQMQHVTYTRTSIGLYSTVSD